MKCQYQLFPVHRFFTIKNYFNARESLENESISNQIYEKSQQLFYYMNFVMLNTLF